MNERKFEYIDREKAIKELTDWKWGLDETCVMQAIGCVPAEDVAPVVRGNWEISEIDLGFCESIGRNYKMKKYKCPVCGYETGTQAEKFVCCPLCTTRMDGDSDA